MRARSAPVRARWEPAPQELPPPKEACAPQAARLLSRCGVGARDRDDAAVDTSERLWRNAGTRLDQAREAAPKVIKVSWSATKGGLRWCREFPGADSFSEDLGGLGASVDPRSGFPSPLQGQTEDFVLRRVLVALHRENRLNHPLTIWARDRAPDFVIRDSGGEEWGLEVTVAASALRQGSRKLNEDCVGSSKPCVLAVYDSCNAYSDVSRDLEKLGDLCRDAPIVPGNPPTVMGFREVLLVCEDGRTVYFDLFGSRKRIEIGRDYNIDFAEWISEQVELLRAGKSADLDIEELTEELGALARREKRALRSHLQVLMHHLLKWEAQPDNRSSSWVGSIRNARDKIQGILEDSPSLWSELRDLRDVYDKARRYAAQDTGLSIDAFPQQCPYVPEGEDARTMYRNGSLQFLNDCFPD